MQLPTLNPITQTQHGAYNAVDFGAWPDPFYYAPEDGIISDINPANGDCGYSFRLTGKTGVHGFCHNETVFVKKGDRVVRGQKLAKMGYTGKTIPPGPNGRHLHWIINQNGRWVYAPSLVNESFIKEGDDMPISQGALDRLIKMAKGSEPNKTELNDTNWMNNPELAIITLWEGYGKHRYPDKPKGYKKVGTINGKDIFEEE